MQFQYGSYQFPVNQLAVTMRCRPVVRSGRPLTYIARLDCSGDVFGSSQSDIIAKETALMVALRLPYQDAILKADSGASTGTRLLSTESLSGVYLVDGPNFTRPDGPEYVNGRHVEFALEAEYVYSFAVGAVYDYVDTVTVRGNGGPRYVWRFPVNAPAEVHKVSLQSLISTTHTGSCVGLNAFPNPPQPFGGRPDGLFVNETESVVKKSPEQHGRGLIGFQTTWFYEYRSVTPIVGVVPAPPTA